MKNNLILLSILFLSVNFISAQNVPTINATIVNGSYPDDTQFKEWERYDKIYRSMFDSDWRKIKTLEGLSAEDRRYMDMMSSKFDGDLEEYPWAVIGPGCSWYCGASYEMKASSILPDAGKNTYKVENLLDDDVRTAWVEGVKGYGIGESVSFIFAEGAARATSCSLVTGYSKDERTWKNNSRVKAFNIYENEKLVAAVNLKDTRCIQSFELKNHRRNKEAMTLKFVITEVYKGDKYDDTAFSEIVFDGEDVHCLAAGTNITMADGSLKKIEDVAVGDSVLSYDEQTNSAFANKVKKLHSAIHQNIVKITLSSGITQKTIYTTDDHPFWSGEDWVSYNPEKTSRCKHYETIGRYDIGKPLLVLYWGKGAVPTQITNIEVLSGKFQTYTLELENGDGCFIANSFVVGQE
ncbi:polymorphic toxin-type HINT domain-containing protein [Dysgonomonas sp. 520]|uniref:NADase-type glycan-binding domain-containing protein n=1 Tax=Dysgonomonas sp. 520 TaxID=2302931 RepID=UPI0013D8D81F|nr:polymorphic toxin-type HINT domain-containing protein [Dysgonomonas sp. 520]NDW10097.1 hypothetical protein [Dysgonomonas sp. 520]